MRLHLFASMLALAALPCLAPDADPPAAAPGPSPPAAPEPKAAKVKAGHIVWVMPGHSVYGIGVVVEVAEPDVDSYRARGLARPANPEEVKAAREAGRLHKA